MKEHIFYYILACRRFKSTFQDKKGNPGEFFLKKKKHNVTKINYAYEEGGHSFTLPYESRNMVMIDGQLQSSTLIYDDGEVCVVS